MFTHLRMGEKADMPLKTHRMPENRFYPLQGIFYQPIQENGFHKMLYAKRSRHHYILWFNVIYIFALFLPFPRNK